MILAMLFAVAEVVPMLGTVLSRMIPMLGASKQENMQWVFAHGVYVITLVIMSHFTMTMALVQLRPGLGKL